nr:hypothetical protein [Tanacetum cinerariifolium]
MLPKSNQTMYDASSGYVDPEQLIENFVDSERSLVYKQAMVLASGNAADRKAKAESFMPLTISDDGSKGFQKSFEQKTPLDCHLLVSNVTPLSWRGHLGNLATEELLDFQYRCYARQAILDNVMN